MKRVAVVAAVAAVVLAACGGGGGSKKTAASGSTTSSVDTSTTVADSSTTVAGAAGATATTKAPSKTATTSGAKVNGQSSGSYTPPAGATPAKPAPVGKYTYDNQPGPSGNTLGAPPPTSTLTVDPPQGTQQTSTTDMGSGNQSKTTLDFRPDGVRLVEIRVTQSGQTLDFVGNPPPLAAPTGVQPGQSVDFDLSSNPPGTNIHVHIDFVRMETITIGGQAVNTMVIHQVGTLSGKYTGTQTQDAWVAPQYDLFAKTHQVADVKFGAFSAHSDVTSTLEKLTPS